MKNRCIFFREGVGGALGVNALACLAIGLAVLFSGCKEEQAEGHYIAGDWGEITMTPLVLTVPLELNPLLREVPYSNPWFFPGWDVDKTKSFFASVSLPPALRNRLMEGVRACPDVEGSELRPEPDDVLLIPSAARAEIYSYLGRFPINYEQCDARRYPAATMSEWVGAAGLQPATVRLLEQLCYRSGTLLFVADLDLLMSQIPDPAEQFRTYKALHRKKTFRVSLRVGRNDDLERLIAYWGGGRYQKHVIPVLQSLQEDGGSIDLVYLMPTGARQLVYQFPDPDTPLWKQQDCHWTALGFLGEIPHQPMRKEKLLSEVYTENFVSINEEDLRFGDVILYLYEENGQTMPVHSSVYICADVVYTKNGTDCFTPWMYMRRSDLESYYSFGRTLQKKFLRRRS